MDWDLRYKDGDKPWDKGSATPVLAELLDQVPEYFKPDSKTLVPGCGLGHDVSLLRKAGLDAYGLDISETALDAARKTYPELGDIWIADDLFKLTEKPSSYDLVWEHTCYCAIQPKQRQEYIESAHRILKSGAYFIGVFFLDTGKAPDEGPPFSTTKEAVITNFSPHFELVRESTPGKSYPGRENREWVSIWRKLTDV